MSNQSAGSSGASEAQPALRLGSQDSPQRPFEQLRDQPLVTEARRSDEAPPMPQPVYVPTALRIAAAWIWRLILVCAGIGVVLWALRPLSTIIVAVLVALILAVLLEPIAHFFRSKLRFPRILASIVTIVLTFTALGTALTLAGREIFVQFPMLRDQALEGFDQLTQMLNNTPFAMGGERLQELSDQVTTWLQENSSNLASGVMSVGATLLDITVGVLIGLFCLIFFLKDGRRIWQWFVRIMPAQARETANEAGIRAWVTLGDYARTQIIVAFIDAIGIAVGAAVFGVPFVIPIGVLVFIASFIPILGAWISGGVAVLVALVTQGPVIALAMVGVVLIVQQLESHVVSPWLMSGAVSLHPLVVFLSVMAGSTLAGVPGALFAVPLCAMINTVVLYVAGHDKMPELNSDWKRPGGPPGVLLPSIKESYRKPTKEHPALSDAQLDALVIERAGGLGASPVPTPVDAHIEWRRRHGERIDPHEGPTLEGQPSRGERSTEPDKSEVEKHEEHLASAPQSTHKGSTFSGSSVARTVDEG